MSWDPDFGQRSPVDLTQGGIRSYAQGLQQKDDEAQRLKLKGEAEADANKPVEPQVNDIVRQWHQRVASGEVDPHTASVHARYAIQNMGTAAPQQDMTGPEQPGPMGVPQVDRTVSLDVGPQFQKSENAGLQAATPQPQAGPWDKPLTRRGLEQIKSVGSIVNPRSDGMEVTRERGNQARLTEEAKNKNRETGQDRKFTHEERMHDATIQQKYWSDAAKIKFDYDKLQAYIDKVHEGTATAKEIAAARLLGAQIVASIGASAKDASSLVNDSDPAIADQKANHDRMQFNTERQLALLGIQGPQPGEPTSGVDGPVYKPNGAGMGTPPPAAAPVTKKPVVKANPDRPPLPASMGAKVRVRLNATGKTGSVDANEFNPKTMTKISG